MNPIGIKIRKKSPIEIILLLDRVIKTRGFESCM